MRKFLSIVCVMSAIVLAGSAALHAAQDQDSVQLPKKTLDR